MKRKSEAVEEKVNKFCVHEGENKPIGLAIH